MLNWLEADANRTLRSHSRGFDLDEIELNRTILKRRADDKLFVRGECVDHRHRLDSRSPVRRDPTLASPRGEAFLRGPNKRRPSRGKFESVAEGTNGYSVGFSSRAVVGEN